MSWMISSALMKDYENSRCSQEQVVAFLEGSCSDGAPSAPSSSTPTPRAFLSADRMTDFSRLSRFGMTCGLLTDDRGADVLMWYLAGFPVRTFQPPAKAQGSPENAADSGPSLLGSLAKFDRATFLWRTPQCSLFEDSERSLEIWPRWGLMRDGVCWEQTMPAHLIRETECGSWPTPVANDAKKRGNFDMMNPRNGLGAAAKRLGMWPTPDTRGFVNEGSVGMLAKMVDSEAEYNRMAYRCSAKKKARNWTTPTARNAKECNALSESQRNTPTLAAQAGGSLNPTWVEWLMGWPLEWTDLKPLVTAKCHNAPHSHGER